MTHKLLAISLAVLLATGCATKSDKPVAWEVKPTVQVRHGAVDAMAFYQLGRHHHQQGQMAAAEEAYVKAVAADPGHADALNALGMIYAGRGDLERAAATFKRVTELAPQKAYLYNNIGYALFLDGRHQEAIDALRKAVTLNPDYERAWVNLRAVAEKAGLTTLAALAAERRLSAPEVKVPRESQPSQDAGAATTVAETPTAAQPAEDTRLAMTPTLKVLTEPSPAVQVAIVEAPQQALPSSPVVVVAPVAEPEKNQPAVPVITLTEVPYKTVALAPTLEPVVLAVASDRAMPSVPDVQTDVPGLPIASTEPRSPERPAGQGAQGRIEVSNGNGITGFATRVGKQLRTEGARVGRITNHSSYKVEQSYIEYRGDWNDAAHALRERLGTHIAMQETKVERKGTDIRVVLGRDSTKHLASLMTPKPSQGGSRPLQLTRNDR